MPLQCRLTDSQPKAKATRKNLHQLASAVKTSAEAELDVELMHLKLIKSAQVIVSKHKIILIGG